jgi:anti-sigma-K factor RskA
MKLTPQAIELLAREYAVGTLHGGARRRFEALQRESPAVADAVAAWQRRLGPLAQSVPAIEPSPALWRGLEQRLFAPAQRPERNGWRLWRWAVPSFGGALAGAALCLLVLTQQPSWTGRPLADGEALPPSYVGLLSDAAGKPVVLASSTRHGRVLSLKLLQPIAVPPGQVARLWALPSDGRAPFAVGVVPVSGKATIALTDNAERLFATVPRLGVRLEPAGTASAAPTAAPENFVISGPCVKLW